MRVWGRINTNVLVHTPTHSILQVTITTYVCIYTHVVDFYPVLLWIFLRVFIGYVSNYHHNYHCKCHPKYFIDIQFFIRLQFFMCSITFVELNF
jgi:hypothetical protein